jgi:exodeoxyribonuclease-3
VASGSRTAAPRVSATGFLTFNIGAASETRAGAILRWLRSRRDDVIVLTETSGGSGTDLLARGLQSSGYAVRHTPAERERGVLIASKLPIALDLSDELNVTLPYRASALVLGSGATRMLVIGVYIPSRDRSDVKVSRKAAFVSSLLNGLHALPASLRDRLVLAGDYNVVARDHEPRLPGFFPWEYEMHDKLNGLGLRPAHELKSMPDHPHSWIGRTGLRYLYDYVHLGTGLHHAVERCAYLHGPRERRLSDHAALAVRLRDG